MLLFILCITYENFCLANISIEWTLYWSSMVQTVNSCKAFTTSFISHIDYYHLYRLHVIRDFGNKMPVCLVISPYVAHIFTLESRTESFFYDVEPKYQKLIKWNRKELLQWVSLWYSNGSKITKLNLVLLFHLVYLKFIFYVKNIFIIQNFWNKTTFKV